MNINETSVHPFAKIVIKSIINRRHVIKTIKKLNGIITNESRSKKYEYM